MTASNQPVRRATVDDVPKLITLWKEEKLPWAELEKNFKEFQVVEEPGGGILGAIGFQVTGLEGRLHGEVFAHFDQSDALREKLWERVQVMAKNHGLVRVWTQMDAPFWKTNGFQPASPAVLAKLPQTWAGAGQSWLFVQLKADVESVPSIDREFALLKMAEKERTEKMHRQAKLLKTIAAVLAVFIFVLAVIWAFSFLKLQGRLPR